MSSFLTFSSDKVLEGKDTTGSKIIKTSVILIFFGLFVSFLALTLWLPTDLFSSALYYDDLGISLVWEGVSGFFGRVTWQSLPRPVSIEGTGFALFLFFTQTALAIEAAKAGSWSKEEDNVSLIGFIQLFREGEVTLSNINAIKAGYVILMLGVGFFDTFTDAKWKASSGTASMISAYWLSFWFNNVGSEWILIWGFGSLLEGVSMILSYGDSVKEMQSQSNKKSTKRKSKPNKNSSTQSQNPQRKPRHNPPIIKTPPMKRGKVTLTDLTRQ